MNQCSVNKLLPHLLFYTFLLTAVLFLQSCEMNKPVKIGFVGGLTGRVADLGIAGRDGVILAIEDLNRKGGINRRPVTLLIRDDMQNSETALQADKELIASGVSAIIGHMTSSMSMAAVKLMNEKKVLMISPTTSTNELSGLDDYFFRVYPASSNAAQRLARHAFQDMGLNNISVIYDIGNRAYTESKYKHFKEAFEAHGGNIVVGLTYTSGPDLRFYDLANYITAKKTDGLLILANAMDTAMICQQLMKIGKLMSVVTGEWSVTDDILKFGGRAVEGIHFFHTFDRENTTPRFVEFRKSFKQRFGYDAGFASAHAYDSANVLFEALRENSDPASLKETIRDKSVFEGLQAALKFDEFGDIERDLFLMTVRDGQFRIIE